MKKIYLAVFLACSIGGAAHAQISEGGIPWSMSLQNEALTSQKIARVDLAAPDYDKYRQEDLLDAINNTPKPYRVEARVYCDISLQNAGTWFYMVDGSKVWRAEVAIPEATALDFFYDKFTLPQGVKYYISNANGRQLLGAYTSANQNEFNSFTNDQIQGNVAVLEMNIPAGVDVSKIDFHVHRIGAGYRGFEALNIQYASDARLAERPTDASPCHINANCPDGDGDSWAIAKSATVRINIDDAGWCSGTLINNTGNSSGTCKPYVLTASHCDSANSRDDSHFANWKFNFNYQTISCDGPSVAAMQTRTGAYFRARSNNPSFLTPDNSLVADFMLLELRQMPLASSNAYLVGWNRATSFADDEIDYRFIGFHHPAGDLKKLSRTNYVSPEGRFNQTVINGTHWQTSFIVGGMEGGSSGSGLFDQDGLLIGDLSGGPEGTGSCAPMGLSALYSKLSYAWNNEFDQTTFPAYAGSPSRLKDWLDPTNSGVTKLNPTTADCATGLTEVETELKNNILLYPVPSISGIVNLKANLTTPSNLLISITDVTGSTKAIYSEKNVLSNTFTLDISENANGVYFVTVESNGIRATHKIILAK